MFCVSMVFVVRRRENVREKKVQIVQSDRLLTVPPLPL
jgi:hypothetical protein